MDPSFHLTTPVLESPALNRQAGRRILLKMECGQPAGFFKLRGVGHLMLKHAADGARHFVCSSAGNAGLAVAHCAAALKVRAPLDQCKTILVVVCGGAGVSTATLGKWAAA